jgi:hypothetical protein
MTTLLPPSCSECGRPIVQSRPCVCRPIGTMATAAGSPPLPVQNPPHHG